jgi:hypothetical protein
MLSVAVEPPLASAAVEALALTEVLMGNIDAGVLGSFL